MSYENYLIVVPCLWCFWKSKTTKLDQRGREHSWWGRWGRALPRRWYLGRALGGRERATMWTWEGVVCWRQREQQEARPAAEDNSEACWLPCRAPAGRRGGGRELGQMHGLGGRLEQWLGIQNLPRPGQEFGINSGPEAGKAVALAFSTSARPSFQRLWEVATQRPH